jgi:hypothetical protein
VHQVAEEKDGLVLDEMPSSEVGIIPYKYTTKKLKAAAVGYTEAVITTAKYLTAVVITAAYSI